MELGRLCVLASCAEPAPAKTGMCCRMVVGLASLAAKEPSQQHALKAQIEPHQRRASDIEPTPAAMARLGCTPQDAAQNCCMGFFALAHGQWDTGLAAMCSTRQPNRTLGMIDGAGSYGARGGREEQQPEAGHNDAPSPRGTTQGHMDSVRRRVGPGAAGAGSALKPASPAHDPGHLQAPWTATLPAHRGVATSGPSTQVLDS